MHSTPDTYQGLRSGSQTTVGESTPDTYQGLRSGSRTIKSSGPFELYKNRLVSREDCIM